MAQCGAWRRRAARALAVALVVAVAAAGAARAAIHSFAVDGDSREWFAVESFGFGVGGRASIELRDLSVMTFGRNATVDLVAFVTERDASLASPCGAAAAAGDAAPLLLADLTAASPAAALSIELLVDGVAPRRAGLYTFVVRNCGLLRPKLTLTAAFRLSFVNAGGNFLSLGDAPLPYVYFAFAALNFVALGVWSIFLCGHRKETRRLHVFMGVLVGASVMSALFDGIKYAVIMQNGEALGVSVVFYIFSFIKGLLLFALLGVMGSGMSLIKSLLSPREKRVFAVVLVLQVLANIAKTVIDETIPGSPGWLTWSDVFYVVDIACCIAILVPITWSVRSLRQSANADGKASRTAAKLRLFQRFYIALIAYLYFTRIVVFLIRFGVPFDLEWLSVFFGELASVAFYVAAGYLFRPVSENPYLRVESAEADDDGADLESHTDHAEPDVPLQPMGGGGGNSNSGGGGSSAGGTGGSALFTTPGVVNNSSSGGSGSGGGSGGATVVSTSATPSASRVRQRGEAAQEAQS